MIFRRITVSIFILISTVNATSRVKISNNGYTDIVVGIHPDIKNTEGEPLIAKIKELFISGSAALYKATRKRSYFKEVTILVPKSWPKKPEYEDATYEVITQADIKIDKANPVHGDGPYTIQPLPCENPGKYIHLTPNYLRQLTENSTVKFGDPGRTLVHEWAHLRYGIFDEYAEQGLEEFPAFYEHPVTGEFLPNSCTNEKLVGSRWNAVEKRYCNSNTYIEPAKECIFLPDKNQNDRVTSSIASYHFLPNVHTFCDDTPEFRHNKYALNRHNRLCDARSTWSVIISHEDFKTSNKPIEISSTLPTFKIVQEEEATISLVLDISTSMLSPQPHTKLKMLYEAATRFIRDEVKLGTAIGVVLFSDSARLALPMTRITNEQERTNVINHIPTTASGYTCIGCGLKVALQDLRRFRGRNGGVIVLLSDGEENRLPTIKDVTQEVLNANIRTITMAFTAAASKNMEELAIASGGKSFFVPLDDSAGKLDIAFFEVSTVQTTEEDVSVKILGGEKIPSSTKDFVKSFDIDPSIGRETVINFLYTDKNDINDITITGPGISVSLKTSPSPDFKIEQNSPQKQIKFIFSLLPIGNYIYRVIKKGSTAQDMTVTILSKSRKFGEDPIVVQCSTHKIINSEPPKFLITAEVKKGSRPVINAQVFVKIDRPNGYASINKQLIDAGKNADIARNDGIYSGYFFEMSGDGRYNVQANVVADIKTATLETGFTMSNALEILTVQSAPPNVTEVATGDFQRVADAGSIQVTGNFNAETTDLYPPNRIDDLHLVSLSGEVVTLQWSAPGDDLTNGQAAEYDLRYTMDFDLLRSQFYGRPFNHTNIPKPAGEIETLKAELIGLGSNVIYYVALKTKDKSGKWSEVSNLVKVRGK